MGRPRMANLSEREWGLYFTMGFEEKHIRRLWKIFTTYIGDRDQKRLSLEILKEQIGLPKTMHVFFERYCEHVAQTEGNICITFKEFVVFVWDICASGTDWPSQIFHFFTLRTPLLDFNELLRIVDSFFGPHNTSRVVHKVHQRLENSREMQEREIDRKLFCKFVKGCPDFIRPALQLQAMVKVAIGGENFWGKFNNFFSGGTYEGWTDLYLQLLGTSEEEIDRMRANIAFAREGRMKEYTKLSKRSMLQRKVENLKKAQPIKHPGKKYVCYAHRAHDIEHSTKGRMRKRHHNHEAVPVRLPKIEKKETASLQRMPASWLSDLSGRCQSFPTWQLWDGKK